MVSLVIDVISAFFQSCYIWFLHISDEKRCTYFQLTRRSKLKMMFFFLLELDVQTFFPIITLISALRKKLNPKKAGRGSIWSLTCGFSKNLSSRERWFFVTFNIIISHIFPENFIEISQVIKKIWSNWAPTRKKLLSKSPSLLGLKSTKYV